MVIVESGAGEQPRAPREPARDGCVWVADQAIHVANPRGFGRWPTLRVAATEAFQVLVNGEPVNGQVVVRAEDRITLAEDVRESPGEVEVSVADDGLTAWATVQPATRRRLRDCGPVLQLDLAPLEVVERTSQPRPQRQVWSALQAQGIVAGIVAESVAEAAATPGTRVRVAAGRPPDPGRPAQVWSLLHGEVRGPVPDPAVPDPAERRAVAVGEPLLRLDPGAPAREGLSVRGEPLPPATSIWLPALRAGPGVLLSADGRTAIAGRAGRPRVVIGEEAAEARVTPEVGIEGDLDDGAGDLAFDGDVWIAGGIAAGRTVAAQGSVEVAGRVVRAVIRAQGGVRVHGGVAHSVVLAGEHALTCRRALALVEELACGVRALAAAAPGALPAHIRRVRAAASRLIRLWDALPGPPERPVANLLYLLPTLAELAAKPLADSVAEQVAAVARDTGHHLREAAARSEPCYFRHIDAAQVEAAGAVVIGAAGAQQARIRARGDIRALGAVRGSALSTWAGASFQEVGGLGGRRTTVACVAGGAFTAALVRAGTVVSQGALVHEFDRDVTEVDLPAQPHAPPDDVDVAADDLPVPSRRAAEPPADDVV